MFKNKKNEKMKIAVSLPRLTYNSELAKKWNWKQKENQ